MSNVRTVFDEVLIPEKSTCKYSCVIKDENDVAISSSLIVTLTLTLYALNTALTVILNGVDILNVGRGTLDTSGNLTITFTPADNAILDDTNEFEKRVALIQGTYGVGGVKNWKHEFQFTLRNLQKVS